MDSRARGEEYSPRSKYVDRYHQDNAAPIDPSGQFMESKTLDEDYSTSFI